MEEAEAMDTEISDYDDNEPAKAEVSLLKLNLSTIAETADMPVLAKRMVFRRGSVPVKVTGTYGKPNRIMGIINKTKHTREMSLKS